MEIALNSHEARVLGVLIEKGYTTPDQYPLTLNAATNGSNQKSNRDPVVDFSEAEVHIALQGLRMKGLVGVSVPAGSRVEKFRHNAQEIFKIGERAIAVLAALLLRGPQTGGELKTRTKRMRDIPDSDALNAVLEELESVGFIEPIGGGRATRYRQLLCPELHPDGAAAASGPTTSTSQAIPSTPPAATPAQPDRVAALEARVDELERIVSNLREELGA